MGEEFQFLDPGSLADGELTLILENKSPGKPEIGHVPAYEFKLVLRDTNKKIGRLNLRIGNTPDLISYAGHIGYAVDPEYRGNRYAARACKLILPLARAHGLSELWITCDPANIASRRTCEIIGAEYVETVPLAEHTDMYKAGDRFRRRYRLVL